MLKTFIFTVIIIAFAVVMLSVRILFKKKGTFPNVHIEGSQAMKERDIHCAIEEETLMRKKMSQRIKE